MVLTKFDQHWNAVVVYMFNHAHIVGEVGSLNSVGGGSLRRGKNGAPPLQGQNLFMD